jgi:hypothetical protein
VNRSPGPVPCYQGQGFFMGFADNALALSVNPLESRAISRAFLSMRSRLNRESNFNYQGIVIVYLGKLRPLSELRNPSRRGIG